MTALGKLHGHGGSLKVGSFGIVLLALIGTFALFAASAQAASSQRTFKEVFGSVAQPTLSRPVTLAVDPNTGDVLVADADTGSISRFKPNGEPDDFSALGSNVIDGARGPGGHTRVECETAPETASCDETPQNKLELDEATEIAVDASGGPASGDIYVTQVRQQLVDIFAATGKYLGQLTATKDASLEGVRGVAVNGSGTVYVASSSLRSSYIAKYVPTSNPPTNADNTAIFPFVAAEHEVNLLASGAHGSSGWLFVSTSSNQLGSQLLKVDETTGEATVFASGLGNRGLALDPATGNPLTVLTVTGSKEVTEFDGSLETEERVSLLISQQGQGLSGFAGSESGDVYTVVGNPTQVYVYGPPVVVPTPIAEPATNVSGTRATLSGTVNPSGLPVSDCKFEWGTTTAYGSQEPCEGTIGTGSEDYPVRFRIPGGLTPDGTEYHFRVVATNANGTEVSPDLTFTTAKRVATGPATEVTADSARLTGALRPEGHQFSECVFEWELASVATFNHSVLCDPAAEEIEPGFVAQTVSGALKGLQPGTAYRFRVSTDAGQGEAEEFTTLGAPRIREVRALNATETTAQLEARINPSGFRTTYHVDWGPTPSYGNAIPLGFEPSVGSGTNPVLATASLSGLATGTAYHYRVVATNEKGTTASPDHELETLNSCGLPDGRCLELVSPKDLGPIAAPGRGAAGVEMHFQAADAPGSLAYVIEGGLSDAPKGAEVLYHASRSDGAGWNATLLSPPISVRNEQGGQEATPSAITGLSPELGCGIVASGQPLTADPVARINFEAGGANLYRINPAGSLDPYTLITDLPPEQPGQVGIKLSGEFRLVGMSTDCSAIVFASGHAYAGLPGIGVGEHSERLYEWREGIGLRSLGWVPGSTGEEVAEAFVGAAIHAGEHGNEDTGNVMSADGSRVFFMAPRAIAGNPGNSAEVGAIGVFVREQGAITRDVSASTTTEPDRGATYQASTPDGSRVYFTANAGLTNESSGEGTDLYEYNLDTSTLKDLTVSHEPGGAGVESVLGVAANGSHAYFASENQLVPGKGKTRLQNEASESVSLYDATEGALHFVATAPDYSEYHSAEKFKSTRISSNGRFLLFENPGNVTGYDSGRTPQVYLYDATKTSEPTVCVSCRQDGGPTQNPPGKGSPRLTAKQGISAPLYEPQSLIVVNGSPEVFFQSRDRLAVGAMPNVPNLYEWKHDQVFFVAAEPAGYSVSGEGGALIFAGASRTGEDLYFFDPAALNWENPQARPAVWDARMGGGFAGPAAGPLACEPAQEGDKSCQGPGVAAPVSPVAGTAGFNGPGNVKPKHKKHHKKHKKHHKKHKKQGKAANKKKVHGKNKQARHANRNRRAGK